MNRIKFLSLAALALCVACSKEIEGGSQPEESAASEQVGAYIPGKAEIKVSEELAALIEAGAFVSPGKFETKSAEVNSSFSMLGVKSIERLFPDTGRFEERRREAGLHLWYTIEYDNDIPQTKAGESFDALPGVEVFEPVRPIRSTAVFNDPGFSMQWHYYNVGFNGSSYVDHCDINAVPVWKEYTTGDPSVVVAVVDGGIDYSHPDIAANYLAGGYNFATRSSRITPDDHGTHVAGTIAAVNNNSLGVSGIAGGDYAKGKGGVKLLSCQIFDDAVEGSGSGASAIVYAADHGAVISQNSWGYVFEKESDAKNANIDSPLKSAIDYFIKNAGCDESGNQLPDSPMKGGVVIFAASNDGWAYNPICEYNAKHLIAVGAVGADYNRAYYSNYGDWVDICAPGGDAKKGPQIYSTIPGSSYGYMQGTSMACPHVSGVAALVVSFRGGQGFTNTDLVNALIGGANSSRVKPGAKIGSLVDALGAVTYGLDNVPAAVSGGYVASPVSNSIDLSFNVTVDGKYSTRAYGYKVFVSEERASIEGLNPSSELPEGVTAVDVLVGDVEAGAPVSVRVEGLKFDTDYYVAVAGYNYHRKYSALSAVKPVKTLANNPPEISYDKTLSLNVKAHETLRIPFEISDPDGHTVSIEYENGSAADAFDVETNTLIITGSAADPGSYTFKITASDPYGLSESVSLTYTIAENHAPVKVKDIDNILMEGRGKQFSLDVDEYISDPDGETLRFEFSVSDPAVVHIVQSDGKFIGTALKYGLVTVTATAIDIKGLKASTSFQVLVKDPEEPVELSSTTVTDKLTIRTSEIKPTYISLTGSTGKVVYENTLNVGAFAPAEIDCKPFAPGIYKLAVRFDGEEYSFRIIKI